MELDHLRHWSQGWHVVFANLKVNHAKRSPCHVLLARDTFIHRDHRIEAGFFGCLDEFSVAELSPAQSAAVDCLMLGQKAPELSRNAIV
jgi:hypothetical protein